MSSPKILEIPQVIFNPPKDIEIPDILKDKPSFPALPSAKYYYVNLNGDKIPMSNNIGNPEEQLLYIKVWYSMKLNDMFPLETVYAKARKDQIGRKGLDIPDSDISFSIKSQIRQYEDSSDWIYEERFQIITGQMKRLSIDDILGDFYRFPLNPSADFFKVSYLLEMYVSDGDEEPIREYLKNCGAYHLENHSFGYYPIYYLFFLLTRFASYPMSENQLLLADRRNKTINGSPESIFIDAIFEYEIYDIKQVMDIIDQIATEGTVVAGKQFETNNLDWIKWADEYLQNKGKSTMNIENIAGLVYEIADKLYTWTDIQIEELCNKLKIEMPLRI